MRYILLTTMILLLVSLVAVPPAGAQSGEERTVKWIENLNQARAAALSENRLILIDFYSEDCSWCKRLDERMQSDPLFDRLAEIVVFARFDGKKEQDLAKRYGVNILPTLILAKPNASEIDRLAGVKPNQPIVETLLAYAENKGTLDDLSKQLRASPKDIELHMMIARKHYFRSQYDSAVAYYSKVMELDKANSSGAADQALFEIGKCYMKAERYDESIEAFAEMEGRFPESKLVEEAYLYIPFVYNKAGKIEDAIRHYRAFRERYPSSDQIEWVDKEIEKLERRKN